MTKKQLLKEINKELNEYSIEELKPILVALKATEEELIAEEEATKYLENVQNESVLN